MAITKNVPEIPTPNINLYVTKFKLILTYRYRTIAI